MLAIAITGNFGFFNFLSATLGLSLLDDQHVLDLYHLLGFQSKSDGFQSNPAHLQSNPAHLQSNPADDDRTSAHLQSNEDILTETTVAVSRRQSADTSPSVGEVFTDGETSQVGEGGEDAATIAAADATTADTDATAAFALTTTPTTSTPSTPSPTTTTIPTTTTTTAAPPPVTSPSLHPLQRLLRAIENGSDRLFAVLAGTNSGTGTGAGIGTGIGVDIGTSGGTSGGIGNGNGGNGGDVGSGNDTGSASISGTGGISDIIDGSETMKVMTKEEAEGVKAYVTTLVEQSKARTRASYDDVRSGVASGGGSGGGSERGLLVRSEAGPGTGAGVGAEVVVEKGVGTRDGSGSGTKSEVVVESGVGSGLSMVATKPPRAFSSYLFVNRVTSRTARLDHHQAYLDSGLNRGLDSELTDNPTLSSSDDNNGDDSDQPAHPLSMVQRIIAFVNSVQVAVALTLAMLVGIGTHSPRLSGFIYYPLCPVPIYYPPCCIPIYIHPDTLTT